MVAPDGLTSLSLVLQPVLPVKRDFFYPQVITHRGRLIVGFPLSLPYNIKYSKSVVVNWCYIGKTEVNRTEN